MDRKEEIWQSLILSEKYFKDDNITEEQVYDAMEQYAKEWEEKYKQANQFICDLGKLLGQDGLGFDDLKWSFEDFRDAIDEKKKEMCLDILEWMGNNNVRYDTGLTEPIFYYKGEWITKEKLFENFL